MNTKVLHQGRSNQKETTIYVRGKDEMQKRGFSGWEKRKEPEQSSPSRDPTVPPSTIPKKMQGVVQFASSFYPPDCWNNTVYSRLCIYLLIKDTRQTRAKAAFYF